MAELANPDKIEVIYATDTNLVGVVKDSAGIGVDLTQSAVNLQFIVRKVFDQASPDLLKFKGTGITVASDGTFTIKIEDTDKTAIPVGTYNWALLYTAINGDVDCIARGVFEVLPQAGVQ